MARVFYLRNQHATPMAEILRVFSGCGLGATGAQGQRLGPPSPATGLKAEAAAWASFAASMSHGRARVLGVPAIPPTAARFRVGKR